MNDEASPTTAQVARTVHTTPATLRRWVKRGLIAQYEGKMQLLRYAAAALAAAFR